MVVITGLDSMGLALGSMGLTLDSVGLALGSMGLALAQALSFGRTTQLINQEPEKEARLVPAQFFGYVKTHIFCTITS